MSCDEVRELLPAYALDALTDEERADVRAHLEGCALHPEVGELRATV
ncbi:MAG: zf-HC2 domain-containing protein, partial [Chloroflexi bacterium]|nr:zf-HC2 domain-containing protein [Chloroflexota bacterium]